MTKNNLIELNKEQSNSTEYKSSQYSILENEGESKNKYGTYIGVFRPTLLTILGVIMYIRMGWVVGNAGLLGAILILCLTFLITGMAALSFSSIITNIRLKAGGIFALVSQSLGLEAGGAIGTTLFLAQSIGAALYIYGFAEGWGYFFPKHDYRLVVLCVYLVCLALTLIGEKLVLKLQVVVMLGVIVALASMFSGYFINELHEPKLIGDFADNNGIWFLFAVFFPAGTGIKVGASLSGKLKDPRTNIPRGVLLAWASAFVIYLLLIVLYSVAATPKQLTTDYLISTKISFWGPAVMIGLLSSCLSATLNSMIAAPNVLAALAKHKIIPRAAFLSRESKGGTYRNATLLNGLIVGLTLLVGDLNRIAQLITMFYLITYATINIVVLIEQSLGLLSFRPTFKVPIWVPITGAVSSVFAMVITNPTFGLIALGMIVAIYIYLEKRQLKTPWETVRSGMLLAFANWAARRAQLNNSGNERAWKPDILLPIDQVEQLLGEYRILLDIMQPKGSLQILYHQNNSVELHQTHLNKLINGFHKEKIFSTISLIKARSFVEMTKVGTKVLEGNFFKPNILFLDVNNRTQEEIHQLVNIAKDAKMGVAIFALHNEARLGREHDINIWIRDQSPNWKLGLRLANLDLAILLGYQICKNWHGKLCLVSAIENEEHLENSTLFLKRLYKDARLPKDSNIWIRNQNFNSALETAPHADINIFGLGAEPSITHILDISKRTKASCIFVIDSGEESALA